MQDLIVQLTRLYLLDGDHQAALAQRFAGADSTPLSLAAGGMTRALVIDVDRQPDDGEAGHWERLCRVANALQAELGLPAPAVSISGASGYRLWLSFEQALPVERVQQFRDALRDAYFPEVEASASVDAPVELPPCLHPASGKWAAFIHPGMGASFADAPGLEMAPPFAAQAAFLEGLQSIGQEQFEHALALLRRPAAVAVAPQPVPAAAPAGLLLKDASLEDIVRFLHAKGIEPTFRHLLPPRS